MLSTVNDRDFLVAGHTDNVPIKTQLYPSNWELSTRRAVEVVHILISQGMNPKLLAAVKPTLDAIKDEKGALEFAPSPAQQGDYVTLEALTDVIVVLSACPQDIVVINNHAPGPLLLDVL